MQDNLARWTIVGFGPREPELVAARHEAYPSAAWLLESSYSMIAGVQFSLSPRLSMRPGCFSPAEDSESRGRGQNTPIRALHVVRQLDPRGGGTRGRGNVGAMWAQLLLDEKECAGVMRCSDGLRLLVVLFIFVLGFGLPFLTVPRSEHVPRFFHRNRAAQVLERP